MSTPAAICSGDLFSYTATSATAGATFGIGLGANVLVGGLDKSVALQPLSVQGNTGLNIAAGVGVISLKFEP